MNKKTKLLEKLYDTLSSTEIMLIMSTHCLLLTTHSKEFVDAQRILLSKMDIRKEVKEYCNMIFDELIVTEK